MKPRICLVPRTQGWTYDSTAHALVRHLSDRFDFTIAYDDGLELAVARGADLFVDFWWAGRLHRRISGRVLKQVSSHRWRARGLNATTFARVHLLGAAGLLVSSERLRGILELTPAARKPIMLGPKGFEPSRLFDQRMRRGPIAIGWAGNASQPDKHVDLLLAADPSLRIADRCLTPGEMGDFYNAIDVISIASIAEGDPRTLIEGMACGCFPVTTDVGIVPDLVRHGENGLIVERSTAAFADAFAWCRANAARVRDAGRRNAIEMLASRTWAAVAHRWADAFEIALSAQS